MAENQPVKKKESSTANKVLTIVGIVLCVVFGLLLIFNLTIIVKGLINPDVPPSVFGITPLVVKSGSMSSDVQHIVRPEDVKELTAEQIASLKVGDTVKTASGDYIENNVIDSIVKNDAGEVVHLLTTRPAEDHIEVDDLIFVKKADVESLKVGDVISFIDKQNTVTTHRIIGITKDEQGRTAFYTKGDANNIDDKTTEGMVIADNVVGIFKGRVSKLGAFIYFLQKPLGMVLFIGVPVLLFIVYDVIRRTRIAKKNKSQSEELEEELKRLRALTSEKEAEGKTEPSESNTEQPDSTPEESSGSSPDSEGAE